MLNGYKILDADAHTIEPVDIWKQYLNPAFQEFAPSPDLKIKGENIYHKIPNRVSRKVSLANNFDSESQIRAMQKMGIDLSFIYPSYGLWLLAIDTMKPRLVQEFVLAYNNWLHDFCSYNPQILRGVGVINLHHPDDMVSELKRIAKFGWKAVCLLPNPVKGRILSNPAYEPFWTECENLGIAIGLHTLAHSRLPTTGADRFDTHFSIHACSHPMEQMMALLALIEGGVLERHPKLRVAFLESGCGWLPYWLWRLDQEYEELYWEVKDNVKMKPSEYFRRQCFIEIEPSEPNISQVISCIGEDNLIFGSDYPHLDYDPDVVKKAVALEEQLSTEVVKKILWDNSVRFYGIES
ncbi:amidohydrolase family protein [Anabaena cylindrica UHCC 0172]|uniref:amidohydrolase family protein n=1 Tax=Anabaena cylindrica TaxID=1165 RepID=UPI002B208352|nr:amidohydrolase family protein [Anabaena cylindrica]MEA5553437.1 amidohydrolase family protein [Anabaena cylindrica UHCC 0172]